MSGSSRQKMEKFTTLTRRSGTPLWVDVGWRVLFVFTLLAIAVSVHWFDKGGLRDNYDGDVSFLDVIYFTMISITTTGYGDIAPVTERARMFDALVVTPIRIFVVLIFIGTAYNFVLKRTWDVWRMKIIQSNLHNHIVVLGYGTSGQEAVEELLARGTPAEDIVVVDSDAESLQIAEELGCAVLAGDATRDTVLMNAKVSRAQAVIVSAGRDDTSILIVLTARHLAHHVPISVSVRSADNEILARQAGATTVINPVSFAGLLLASSCHGANISDYLSDLASIEGRVKLNQRLIEEKEIGRGLGELLSGGIGVRIYRDGKAYGFWEEESKTLAAGDTVVEIIPGKGVKSESDMQKVN